MNASVGSQLERGLGRLGQAWGWIVAYGVFTLVAGIIAIVYPSATLVAIAIIFAIQLIVTAVFRFAYVFAIPNENGWLKALTALVAILSLVIGIYLLGHLGLTLLLLAILLGAFWLVQGVMELFLAVGHPELRGRAWTVVSGLLSIVAGIVLVVYPGISLVAVAIVLGVWLVIFGVTMIARGVQLRSVAHQARPAAA